MTTSTMTRGTLSVQQETTQLNGHGRDPIWQRFALPGSVSMEELRRRVERMTAREPGLRTVAVDRTGVTYADLVQAPIISVPSADPQDRDRLFRAALDDDWEAAGPLWRLVVFTPTKGAPTEALLVIDHLIADVVTAALIAREIRTGQEPEASRGGGRFEEWARRQRSEFDPRNHDAAAEARSFWTEALGGTSPRRATALPAIRDAVPGSGANTVAVSIHVPIDPATIVSVARKARTTPFMLAMASFAATIAAATDTDDMSFAVVHHGRGPAHAAVYGWLATVAPVRIVQAGLSDLSTALTAVRKAWGRILGRLDTPWEYITGVCAGTGELDWGPVGHRQFLINYFTEPVAGITPEHYRDQHPEFPRGMRWLELQLIPLDSGGHMFRFLCNSDDLDPESVRELLQLLADGYTHHVDLIQGELR
ncbi:hypothetical protein GCM10009745_71870 [Kribbella yunnanensis]|uniref:Condensation domain-containing protein n=1 Tax=Kribbella yunnanensis TaxID=190194 RepID=A0ABN2IWM0_9ACTN